MRDLLQFPSTIYDTNCIVYYCFRIEDRAADGGQIVIQHPDTPRARHITDELVGNAKTLCTLVVAWSEVGKVLTSKALQGLIDNGYIAKQLRTDKQISPSLRLRLAMSLKREMVALARKGWFDLVHSYTHSLDKEREIKELYAQFARDPATQNRIPPYKGNPSRVDIALILYSGHARLPLLTNDGEIANFAPELRERGFCELIKPFRRVRF